MHNIIIEETTHSPRVEFYTDGRLLLEGRSIPENAANMFDSLIQFAKDLDKDTVVFDINLEYFNTATSKKLMELFRQLDTNDKIQNLYVNWHYEEGDEDIKLLGVFTSKKNAVNARKSLLIDPSLKNSSSNLQIFEEFTNRMNWEEGFITWKEAIKAIPKD